MDGFILLDGATLVDGFILLDGETLADGFILLDGETLTDGLRLVDGLGVGAPVGSATFGGMVSIPGSETGVPVGTTGNDGETPTVGAVVEATTGEREINGVMLMDGAMLVDDDMLVLGVAVSDWRRRRDPLPASAKTTVAAVTKASKASRENFIGQRWMVLFLAVQLSCEDVRCQQWSWCLWCCVSKT